MKIFYWLIIIMDITLMILLWLYIYDFYIQDRYDGLEYADHIFNSDEAIPVIALGVILNTGALFYAMIDARRRKNETRASVSPSAHQSDSAAGREEIRELEEELEQVVSRLDELRKKPGIYDDSADD